jgi:DNA-binding transcriptional MerR regulator
MPTKRDLEQVKKLDFLKMSELAELCGVRYSTVKYYSELALLPYEQKGKRLAKYYPRIEASNRLKAIRKLRQQGKTIPEIINYFMSKGGPIVK